jgi:hypothetical protein
MAVPLLAVVINLQSGTLFISRKHVISRKHAMAEGIA